MIKYLAELFRGVHFVLGISTPAPGTTDRKFVFAWLGSIAFFVAFFLSMFYYIIPFLYFKH